ncbi:MAG TPA: hypothetical protein VGF69_12525 [Thermoanaerobaculia bacterium]|jgi:hypothetical protein
MIITVLAWLFASTTAVPPRHASAGAQPLITVSENAIEITGLTPGHHAVLFGLEREQEALQAGTTRVTKLRLAAADDAGRVVFTSTEPLLPHALWIAVDEKSGRYSISAPEGSELLASRPDVAPVALVKSAGEALELPADLTHLLVIRAAHGVWFGTVADGGASDDDPNLDGKSRLKPEKLHDADKAAKKEAKRFEKADTIIVVEPVELRYSVIEVQE